MSEGNVEVWRQESLLPPSALVIDARFSIDGPLGQVCASVKVTEFWTGDLVALEVMPASSYPGEWSTVVSWVQQRSQFYASTVAPF
jgi:hypothetical protein